MIVDLLADERVDLLVGDGDLALVGDRLEHELARDRLRGLGAQRVDELLGVRPLSERYVSSDMPRRSTLRASPFSSSRVRDLDERAARFDASPRATSASTAAAAELPLELGRRSARAARCSMSARSSSSVSNSLTLRARSSSSGGSTFSWISFSVTSTGLGLASRRSESRPRRARPALMPTSARLELGREPVRRRARRRSRGARRPASTRSSTRTSPGCAGRSSTGERSAAVS